MRKKPAEQKVLLPSTEGFGVLPLVEVTWIDHSRNEGPITAEWIQKMPYRARTPGYIAAESDECIFLTQTEFSDGERHDTFCVLKSDIVSILICTPGQER